MGKVLVLQVSDELASILRKISEYSRIRILNTEKAVCPGSNSLAQSFKKIAGHTCMSREWRFHNTNAASYAFHTFA